MTLPEKLLNCTCPRAFQMLLAGGNVYIADVTILSDRKSNVLFAYVSGEGEAFSLYMDRRCLGGSNAL